MNVYQVVKRLKELLEEKKWADESSNKVFGSVRISQFITDEVLAELRMPIVLIRVGSASSDDEEPGLLKQTISLLVINMVQGDFVGERSMIGANKQGDNPKGRGLLEIEEQLASVIRLLTQDKGIKILSRFMSDIMVEVNKNIGYLVSREYTLEVLCTDTSE